MVIIKALKITNQYLSFLYNTIIEVVIINNEIINRIIQNLDSPLMLTSANISGKNVSKDIFNIVDEFDGKVDMIIVGTDISSVSSTIVELKKDRLVLIREGAIPFKNVEEVFYGDPGDLPDVFCLRM